MNYSQGPNYPLNQPPRPQNSQGCAIATLGCGAGCMLYPIVSAIAVIVMLIIAVVLFGTVPPTVTRTATGVVIANNSKRSITSMNVMLDTKDTLHYGQVYYFTDNHVSPPAYQQAATIPYTSFKAPSGHPLNVKRFQITGFRIDYNDSWGGQSHFSGSL